MKKIFITILSLVFLSGLLISSDDVVKFTFLFTNDIHGGIVEQPATFMNPDFPPILGGGATLMNYVNKVRENAKKNNETVILGDMGDFFQGTPIGNNTKGMAILDFMNKIGYDFWVVGNHEFDLGADVFWNLVKNSKMPVLAANLVKKDTKQIPEGILPYIFKEIDGIKVAIIGITSRDTETMSYKENFKGLQVLDEVEVLQKYVNEVKSKGADVVILAIHSGLAFDANEYFKRIQDEKAKGINRTAYYNVQDIVNRVRGIDVAFAGHTHAGFNYPYEDPQTHTLIFENYAKGSSIGHVILKVDKKTKKFIGYEAPEKDGVLVSLFKEEFGQDKETENMISLANKEAEKGYDEVIGYTEKTLDRGEKNSLFANLINDAIIEISGADFSFINLGGMRDDIKKGPITFRDIFRAMPFDNKIVVIKLKGWQLLEVLESRIEGRRHGVAIGGGQWFYSKALPDYGRTYSLIIQGKPWDPEKEYKVATADFIAEGNLGLTMLAAIPDEDKIYTGVLIKEAVAQYIKKHSPLNPQYDGRVKQDDKVLDYSPEMKEALEKLKNLKLYKKSTQPTTNESSYN